MKIIYNAWLKADLFEHLLSQDGINRVQITEDNNMDCIIIDTNISPSIVAKYIDLFQESKWSTMFAFDKQNKKI